MTDLPRGTVTLLFTDIEGSTQLQHRLGERYQDVVREHRRLLEASFDEHGGVVVDRQTESFFVVFTRARHAAQAAADAQQALAEQEWPDGVQVKVRMGIHSGDPELAGDRYVGLAVSRAARVCASAHGGQVLLSSSARGLLSDHDRTALRSLGSYRLKDFAEPEPISQLIVDGLPSQFPPIRTEAVSSRKTRLLLVGAGLLLAAMAAVAIVTFTSGGGSVEVGPTSLAVIDPDSNEVTDAIDLGFKSNLIAAGEGHVWVVDPTGSTLRKIDPQERRVTASSRSESAPGTCRSAWQSAWEPCGSPSTGGRGSSCSSSGPRWARCGRRFPTGRRPLLPPSPGCNRSPWAAVLSGLWTLPWVASGGSIHVPGDARKLAEGLGGSLARRRARRGLGCRLLGPHEDRCCNRSVLGSNPVGSEAFSESASVALGVGRCLVCRQLRARPSPRSTPRPSSTSETFTVGRGPSGVAIGEGAVWVANSRDGTVSRVDPEDGEPETLELGAVPGGIVTAFGAVWTSPGEPRG